MGVVFYKRVDPFFANGGIISLLESFEYSEGWPGTISNPNYTYTYTGFDSPSTNLVESFEYSEGWPGTISNPNYTYTYTGFDSPSTNLLESFEYSEGWPGTSP